ncbi:Holliday junction resolvasome RuvABC endonuclease subunit [Streptomyces sp. B4I13]|uniref:Holliday junction endonuclease n=1 Tax=Streptomyces sp. B4I13 TaxID=3042271 RepID=UPI00277EE098|nr:Holliday junction endonuclease [Streptomyces sp. B4I13]MDQ0961948.1 Holliday junction resolvasome RuvABC endonuclease subunit [Streptomyces sp. B4I13]
MSEQRTFTVAGLDLSLTASGIAYRDGSTSTVKTRQKDGDGRLAQIEEAVQIAVGGEHLGLGPAVELVAMEDIPQNSHAAKPISMVYGVVRNLLQKQGIPYVLITPATLKTYATGKGSGDKVPMALAAYKRAGREFEDDNQCDAAWLRWAGLDWLGCREFSVPAVQREALKKAIWPEVKR